MELVKRIRKRRARRMRAPQKPVVSITEIGSYRFSCPICNSKVAWGYQERADRCYGCGQRINWEGFPEPNEEDSLDRNWITEAYRIGVLETNRPVDHEVQRYEARVIR